VATIAHLHRPPRPTTARAPHPPLTSLLVAAVLVLFGSVMTVVAVGFWVTATSVTATVIRVVDSDDDLVVRWTDPRTGEDRTNQIFGYDDEIELVERLALAGPLEGELVEHFDLGFWTATGLVMLTTGAGLGLRWRRQARELAGRSLGRRSPPWTLEWRAAEVGPSKVMSDPVPSVFAPAGPGTPTGYGVPPHDLRWSPVAGPIPYWPYLASSRLAYPDALLARGTSALRTASVLLWCLVAAHALMAIGALALIVVADGGSATDIEGAEGIGALGLVAWFGLGTALWVMLGLWCSRTSLAARAAGNQRDSESHMAWWGLFVPVAGLLLPFLAYREAAKYTQAVVGAGAQPRGAGEAWRTTRVPLGVPAWWLLFVASSLCLGAFSAVDPAEDLLEGIFVLGAAMFGAASAICGALSLRRLTPR
jgi:hypothetical protein